jgi:hypothetical protein
LSLNEYCSVHVPPLFLDTNMFPALSTAAQVSLDVHAMAETLFVPSMSCLVAFAVPLLSTARLSTSPTPSTARQELVETQAMPLSPVVPSTFVSFHDDDSIWVVLVAMWTLPDPSAIPQKDDDRQDTPFMLADPCASKVQDVEAGLVA